LDCDDTSKTRKRRASHLRAAVMVVVLGPFVALLATGHISLACPSGRTMPVRGIDVSHHQGAIDWAAVAAAGIDFAYLKATEGGDWVDPRFETNWREAGAQRGLLRGAYHFFTFCRPGDEQARNFIATVPASTDALPPAVDFEIGGNCSRRPPREELLDELRLFLSQVEDHFGRRPLIYVTRDAHEAYLQGELPEHPIWARDLFRRPPYPEGRPWLVWQFHNRGRVRGIDGPVDLNAFAGSTADFNAWRTSGIPDGGH